MSELRPVRLVMTAVLTGGLVWLLAARAQALGRAALPMPWLAPVVLAALTVAILIAGRRVRAWIAGRRPMSALAAARVAAAAAASGWAGALLCGWYGGQAGELASALVGGRTQRFVIAVVAAVVAALLAGAGVLVQRWCRRPDDDTTRGPVPERHD